MNPAALAVPVAAPHARLRPAPALLRQQSWKSSFAELWRDARGPSSVLLFWAAKLLHKRLDGSIHDANVESLAECVVDRAQVPARFAQKLDLALAELVACGFEAGATRYTAVRDLLGPSLSVAAILPHRDGRSCARVTCREDGSGLPPKTHLDCELFAQDAGGRILLTSGVRARPDAPATVEVVSLAGAPTAALWKAHQARLGEATRIEPLALVERHHALARDFHLARGRFRALTPAEREDLAALEATWERHEPAGELVAGTLVECVRLQQKRSGVPESLLLLLVSLVAFVATWRTGSGRTFTELLTLVPVLFFHELGHWLAMRRFGYGNVRMLFLPFLGAAVTGREQGVSSAKQALVALAGPLPGIVAGLALALVGARHGHAVAGPLAMTLLALNGINLLPVFPLDGGRVIQILVFSRSAWLDVGFRGLAALALLWAGTHFDDSVLRSIGIFLLISLPSLWAVRRAEAALRQRFAPASSDPQQLAPDAAQWLVGELHARRKKVRGKRVFAQLVQQALTQAATRPPRWAASLGLGTLLLLGLLFSVVGLALAARAPHGATANVFGVRGQDVVEGRLLASDVVRLPASAPRAPSAGAVLARFSSTNRAAAVAAAHPELDVLLLGPLLTLSRPADAQAHDALVRELRASGARVVDPKERLFVPLHLQCTSEEAAQLQAELASSCALAHVLQLQPAWATDLAPETLRARATLTALVHGGLDLPIVARAAGHPHTMDELLSLPAVPAKEIVSARSELSRRKAVLERERARPGADLELVEAFARAFPVDRVVALAPRPVLPVAAASAAAAGNDDADDDDDSEPPDPQAAAWQQLGAAFASKLALAVQASPLGARMCSVQRREAALSITVFEFTEPTRGPEAVVRWLEGHGCGDLRLRANLPLENPAGARDVKAAP